MRRLERSALRALASTPRSMPAAIAGTPYTTACSPSRITLPLARAICRSAPSRSERFGRTGQELDTLPAHAAFEFGEACARELRNPGLDGRPRARRFEHRQCGAQLGRGRVGIAHARLQGAKILAARELQARCEQRGAFARTQIITEWFTGL